MPLLLANLACLSQTVPPPGIPTGVPAAAGAPGNPFRDGPFHTILPNWPEIDTPDEDSLLAVASEGEAITVARYEAVPRTLGEHFARVLPDFGDFQAITLTTNDPAQVVLDANLDGAIPQRVRMVFLFCGGVSYRITGSAPPAVFDHLLEQLQQILDQATCEGDMPPVADEPGLIGLVANPAGADYRAAAMYHALAEARHAGVQATHVYLQWADVEKEPGIYDWAVADFLIDLPALAGLRLSLVINFIHTSLPGPMPPDIVGRPFADAEYVARAAAFAAAVAERYATELDYLALGNEVNIFFATHPDEQTPYLAAWRAMRAAVRAVRPELPTGIVFAFHEAMKEGTFAGIDSFRETDFLAYTYYPHGDSFNYDIDSSQFATVLEQMITVSGDTPFIIVENGFATAPALGGDEARQAAYIQATFAALATHREAFGRHIWYALHDGEPTGCAEAARSFFPTDFDAATAVGAQNWQRFQDYLCTLGLKYHDGSAKPGWEAFAEAVQSYENSHR